MGVQVSKELTAELNRTAAEAATSETTRVDHLLFSNPNVSQTSSYWTGRLQFQFVSRLSTIWKELLKESKTEIQCRSCRDTSKVSVVHLNSSHYVFKYLSQLQNDITSLSYVKNFFKTLKTNLLTVLNKMSKKNLKT